MEAGLLNQGMTLMLVGMVTVFTFLTILVAAMTALSAVAIRFSSAGRIDEPGDDPSEEEVAAITAAITKHRSQ